MRKKYEIVAKNHLTQEMEVIAENHRVLYWDDYVIVELFDIREVCVTAINEESGEEEIVNTYYERKTVAKDEDGNTIFDEKGNIVYVWVVDETFDISKIENIINAHQPVINPIIEELEELDKTIPRWGEDALEGKLVFGEVKEAIERKKELRALL